MGMKRKNHFMTNLIFFSTFSRRDPAGNSFEIRECAKKPLSGRDLSEEVRLGLRVGVGRGCVNEGSAVSKWD